MADELNGEECFSADVVEENMDGVEGEEVVAESETTGSAQPTEESERTLFVGGLSWETTARELKEYFSKYGEILKGTIKTEPESNRSRGFGFVLFAERASVDKVLEEGDHKLGGRKIDPKIANPKPPLKKVFVGGVDSSIPESEIREFFGKFGKIETLELPFDKVNGHRRAFCFIEFETEAVANAVIEKTGLKLGSKQIDVKKATPQQQAGRGGSFGGGFRGRGSPFSGRGGSRGGRDGRGGFGRNDGWEQGGGYYDYHQGSGYGYGDYGQSYAQNYDYGYGGGQGYGGGWGGGYDPGAYAARGARGVGGRYKPY